MGHVTIPIPELQAWSTSVRRHTGSVVVALSSEVLFNFGHALLRAHASTVKQVTTVEKHIFFGFLTSCTKIRKISCTIVAERVLREKFSF